MHLTPKLLQGFFVRVARGEIDIYNKFNLQHELSIYVRYLAALPYTVQFERPVSFFGKRHSDFVKKEIDIAIFTNDYKQSTRLN